MANTKEEKVLAANRAAFHEYHISDKYEAGIALTGTEVKSVMGGRVQLKESYVAVRDGERSYEFACAERGQRAGTIKPPALDPALGWERYFECRTIDSSTRSARSE